MEKYAIVAGIEKGIGCVMASLKTGSLIQFHEENAGCGWG
jgi:hypothetical protein